MQQCLLDFLSSIGREDVTAGTELEELAPDERQSLAAFVKKHFAKTLGTATSLHEVAERLADCEPVAVEKRMPPPKPKATAKEKETHLADDCVFCDLIGRRKPARVVHETDLIFCFLDLCPLSAGHVLCIPKYHCEKTHELPLDYARALGEALAVVTRGMSEMGMMDEYNILNNNGSGAFQSVLHCHYHIIPKTGGLDGLRLGLWKSRQNLDLDAIASKIRAKLKLEAK